jgi:hypothetical protein
VRTVTLPARAAITYVRSVRLVVVTFALAACGGDAPTLVDDPLGPFPATIAGLGLDDERALPYDTRYPFWANGAEKDRLVVLPAPIDNTVRDRWAFPAGTLLFKTFRFPGAARPAETRVLRRTDDGWDYAAYRWRDDADDGDLLELAEPTPVPVSVDGVAFDHLIPSRLDCRTCHEQPRGVVLGLDELGLGADGLAALDDAGLLAVPPPADPEEIVAAPLERDALGVLEASCAHCHDGGDGPSSAFDLRHGAAVASTLCQPTSESHTAAGYRIVPGDPGASILFLAVSGETDDPEVKAMPPLGVQHRDAAGIEVLRAWILSLDGACP